MYLVNLQSSYCASLHNFGHLPLARGHWRTHKSNHKTERGKRLALSQRRFQQRLTFFGGLNPPWFRQKLWSQSASIPVKINIQNAWDFIFRNKYLIKWNFDIIIKVSLIVKHLPFIYQHIYLTISHFNLYFIAVQ